MLLFKDAFKFNGGKLSHLFGGFWCRTLVVGLKQPFSILQVKFLDHQAKTDI